MSSNSACGAMSGDHMCRKPLGHEDQHESFIGHRWDAIPNRVQPGTFGPVFDAGVEEGKRQARHATPNSAAERVALELIDARDRAETYADELAATIGAMLDVDLGEHSNLNNPWQNALDAASGRRAT